MNSVEEKVIKILRRFSPYYQFPLNSKLRMDLRLNEIDLIELNLGLEEEFGITLPDDRYLDKILNDEIDYNVEDIIHIVKHELIKVKTYVVGGK